MDNYRSYQSQGPANAWNDPPKTLFGKASSVSREELATIMDGNHIMNTLKSVISELRGNGSDKRMLDDTEKRLEFLRERLTSNAISDSVRFILDQVVRALDAHEYHKASELCVQLMTTNFDLEGKWVLGLKRLTELRERTVIGNQGLQQQQPHQPAHNPVAHAQPMGQHHQHQHQQPHYPPQPQHQYQAQPPHHQGAPYYQQPPHNGGGGGYGY